MLDSNVMTRVAGIGSTLARNSRADGEAFDLDEFVTRLSLFLGGSGGNYSRKAKGKGKQRALDSDASEDSSSDELETAADEMDWDKLGRLATRFTRRAPTLDFMLGPLKTQYTKRIVKQRAKIDRSSQAAKPIELGSGDMEKNENETTRKIQDVARLLEHVSGEGGVNLFEFALDPESFGNSVENLFYISFLLRDGKCAYIMPGEDSYPSSGGGAPVISKCHLMPSGGLSLTGPFAVACEEPSDEDYAAGLAKRQIVLELDMNTWKSLIEYYYIMRSIITTRRNDPVRVVDANKWYN